MRTQRQILGSAGENLAEGHYISRGGLIRHRNISYPCGEIDLIVEEADGTVVFVEVKTRRGIEFGTAEAVTGAKMRRLPRAAARWLEHKPFMAVRFDVLVVTVDRHTGEPLIDAYEGVEHGAR